MATIFGMPVAPDVAMRRAYSGTWSSSASEPRSTVAAISSGPIVPGDGSAHPATTTLAPATSKSRSRSHCGRSQRSGSTEAPNFQAAKVENRCSGVLRRARAMVSLSPSPPPAKSRATWFDRSSISCQVMRARRRPRPRRTRRSRRDGARRASRADVRTKRVPLSRPSFYTIFDADRQAMSNPVTTRSDRRSGIGAAQSRGAGCRSARPGRG